jgi:hypothetical protein
MNEVMKQKDKGNVKNQISYSYKYKHKYIAKGYLSLILFCVSISKVVKIGILRKIGKGK